jgi:nucleotide-binding universal stress UspA family protein
VPSPRRTRDDFGLHCGPPDTDRTRARTPGRGAVVEGTGAAIVRTRPRLRSPVGGVALAYSPSSHRGAARVTPVVDLGAVLSLDDAPSVRPFPHTFGRRFNRVLAPVTYHPFSEAMSLAAGLGVHVRVLHVVQYHNTLHGGGFAFESEEDAATLVEAAAFDVQLNGAAASTAVLRAPVNSVASRILQAARGWGAEAIVLGSYRDRGMSTMWSTQARSRGSLRMQKRPVQRRQRSRTPRYAQRRSS